MAAQLTIEDVARRVGEPVERIREWHGAGLLGTPDGQGFTEEDAERARLFVVLARRGMPVADIARWAAQGPLERYLQGYVAPRLAGPLYTLDAAAARVGLPVPLAERVWEAMGCSRDEPLDEDDVGLFTQLRTARESGQPDDALVQVARVLADGMRRITESETRLFHFYVSEALRAQGLTGSEYAAALRARAEPMRLAAERMLLHMNRRFMRDAVREVLVMADVDALPGELAVALAFVDLSSFTPLAEAMGDLKSAEVLDRFSVLVRRATQRLGGRVAKQIGDGFMLSFPEPRSAVLCVLEIMAQAGAEAQFPAVRAGVHWGRALYRDGDYVGTNVNLAARVVEVAERSQMLVTGALRQEVGTLPGTTFMPAGRRRLKGLAEPVELFAVQPSASEPAARVVDPVCGMRLRPTEVAARLTVDGQERAFCSAPCLQRFVAAPERYGAG